MRSWRGWWMCLLSLVLDMCLVLQRALYIASRIPHLHVAFKNRTRGTGWPGKKGPLTRLIPTQRRSFKTKTLFTVHPHTPCIRPRNLSHVVHPRRTVDVPTRLAYSQAPHLSHNLPLYFSNICLFKQQSLHPLAPPPSPQDRQHPYSFPP